MPWDDFSLILSSFDLQSSGDGRFATVTLMRVSHEPVAIGFVWLGGGTQPYKRTLYRFMGKYQQARLMIGRA